jgi:PKD repeat protein
MRNSRLFTTIAAISIALTPVSALAAGELEVQVNVSVDCDLATFQASVVEGASTYSFDWDFGDSETLPLVDLPANPEPVPHTYPAAGAYDWSLFVMDLDGGTGEANGTVLIEGPMVTLTSDPFPPLVMLEGGTASVAFTAEVVGEHPPFTYTWDLNGDGNTDQVGDAGEASFGYTEAGKFQASVLVVDACGLAAEDTLPVVVTDPEAEACHPMAQRIADAVNTLFPNQAETLYTCEDIFAIFQGSLTGSQVGFGRLWHAFKLSQTMEDLTWEEIRDWHLDGNGWGLLVQLDRFADTLEQVGLRELVDRVLSGEASVGDIRHAVRAVVRYEADFEEALTRLADGSSPGQLGRLYRTAQDLGVEPSALDQYLTEGATLQELNHASRLASRTGSDWQQVLEAHAAGQSWGEINRAQHSANSEGISNSETSPNEASSQLREEAKAEREVSQNEKTAARLAKQYGVSVPDVWALFKGSCAANWSCVRAALRQGTNH